MTQPTLAQVFGSNCTQTSTDLVIKKSDLVAVGLTASATNNAEALLVAIILKAKEYLTETLQEADNDVQVTVVDGLLPSFVIRGNQNYRRDTLTIQMDKLSGATAIDPDDY